MHGFCCPSGVYESSCTISFTVLYTNKGVLDTVCSVVNLATRTTCCCSSLFTVSTLPSVTFSFLVVVRISTDAFCTTNISTDCKLYETIFHLARKSPLAYLSIKDILRNMETAKFLKFQNTTYTSFPHTYVEHYCTDHFQFLFFALYSRCSFMTWAELLQSGLAMSSYSKYPVSIEFLFSWKLWSRNRTF